MVWVFRIASFKWTEPNGIFANLPKQKLNSDAENGNIFHWMVKQFENFVIFINKPYGLLFVWEKEREREHNCWKCLENSTLYCITEFIVFTKIISFLIYHCFFFIFSLFWHFICCVINPHSKNIHFAFYIFVFLKFCFCSYHCVDDFYIWVFVILFLNRFTVCLITIYLPLSTKRFY